jgi:hypothetical protein
MAQACGVNDEQAANDDPSVDVGQDLATPQHILLFGGTDDKGHFFSDTWTFDGVKWTQHNVPGPSMRWGSVGAALNGDVVMFGGGNPGGFRLGDTWIWDGSSWTQAQVSHHPSARVLSQGARVSGQFVIYGGYDFTHGGVDDIWSWDGTAWTQDSPITGLNRPPGSPPGNINYAATRYDSALFISDGADVWSWSYTQRKWTPHVNTPGPPERIESAAAPLGGNVVLFGGCDGSTCSIHRDDTWSWNGSTWTNVNPSSHPSKRDNPGMATLGSDIFLFGGHASQTDLADTWKFDGTNWTLLSATGPSARTPAIFVAY